MQLTSNGASNMGTTFGHQFGTGMILLYFYIIDVILLYQLYCIILMLL